MKEMFKAAIIEGLNEIGHHFWEALKYTLIQSTYEIALIGGGICIILGAVGWAKGNKVTGILFVIHVLVRYLIS
ncbi:MAG: hypothetical protein ACYCX4_14475 [Bacillota bacterium]